MVFTQKFLFGSSGTRKVRKTGHSYPVNVEQWPQGLEMDAALLDLTTDEISRRTGARFKAGADGLDRYEAAVIRIRPDVVIALQQYEHYPVPGVKLVINDKDASKVDTIVGALGLRGKEVRWVAPDLEERVAAALSPRAVRRSRFRSIIRTRDRLKRTA